MEATATTIDPTPEWADAKVAIGAAFLDAHYPDWHKRINRESLTLYNLENCILGQLFGDYWTASREPAIKNAVETSTGTPYAITDLGYCDPCAPFVAWANENGFNASDGHTMSYPGINALTEAWQRHLDARNN